jgi:hypothetical protein
MPESPISRAARQNSGSGMRWKGQRDTDCFNRGDAIMPAFDAAFTPARVHALSSASAASAVADVASSCRRDGAGDAAWSDDAGRAGE